MNNLPSDITLTKWKKEYELYKEAHNGLPEYLSYELECTKKELQAEREKVAFLREAVEACAHIGVDCGYGEYTPEWAIYKARQALDKLKDCEGENKK